MDIRHLEYFLQVIKDKSITKAAQNLYLTQPALSKTIKNLETELGVTLFYKTPHGIEPTDCGIQLANNAAPLVDAFSHIHEQLHNLSELKHGRINIGIGPMFGFAYLNEILNKFHEEYSNIEIFPHVMSIRKLLDMLQNYDIDLAIAHTSAFPQSYSNLKSILINADVMALACNKNHKLCMQPTISLYQLQEESINICSKDYALYESILQHFQNAGIKPNIRFECNSIELLLDLTVSSDHVCILPYPYLKKISNCFPDMEIIQFDPPLNMSTYLWLRDGSYNSYATLVFAEFIENFFNNYKT